MYVTTLDEMNGNAKPFLFSTAIAVNEEKHLKLVGHYYDLKYFTSMTFWPRRLACAMRACVRHA